MYAVCCQYPNGEGFNITTNNSACQTVGTEDINNFFNGHKPGEHGIIVAAPEVPLETRLQLLKKGKEYNCYNVASVSNSEAELFVKHGGIGLTDLIALNKDEALAFASLKKGKIETEEEIPAICENYLQSLNPEISIIITLGSKGAIGRFRDSYYRSDAVNVQVINTAGAGDCFLGTVIAARARGVDLLPQKENHNKLSCAMDLGIAASGKKVESKDTIDFSINCENLEKFTREHGMFFSDEIQDVFFGCCQKNLN
jgi:sugar/nucleoside kinase (ribokinase family)